MSKTKDAIQEADSIYESIKSGDELSQEDKDRFVELAKLLYQDDMSKAIKDYPLAEKHLK